MKLLYYFNNLLAWLIGNYWTIQMYAYIEFYKKYRSTLQLKHLNYIDTMRYYSIKNNKEYHLYFLMFIPSGDWRLFTNSEEYKNIRLNPFKYF